MMREVVAIIPARGGSKGVLRKNVKPFLGEPLVVHSIGQALASSGVTRVVVSTDDPEIAEVSEAAGAEVIWRPHEICDDIASSESALQHVLLDLRNRDSYEPDLVVFLQATSPLRPEGTIDDALKEFSRAAADSLFSACRLHGFVWRQSCDELQSLTYDFALRPRRQDTGIDWLENGSVYIFKPWVLERFGNRLGGKVTVFDMSPFHSYQIDEPPDFGLLEDMARLNPPKPIFSTFKKVELLVLDFDGVMTDNKVVVSQNGTEAVSCHRGDSLGLALLQEAGVRVVVLSKETSQVVAARCRKISVTCIQAVDDKLPRLKEICRAMGVERKAVAYVGNDVNDIECVRWSGIGVAVADSHEALLAVADCVLNQRGGNGAIREVCDSILTMNGGSDG